MLRLLRSSRVACPQQIRGYQSEKGIYGYRPVAQRQFQVPEEVLQSRNAQANVYRWIEAYRKHGHKLASVNPISIRQPKSLNEVSELKPEFYGLSPTEPVQSQGLFSDPRSVSTIGELQQLLQEVYCGKKISAEFSYVENLEEREWLAQRFEALQGKSVEASHHQKLAELLIKAQTWEEFMAAKYPTVKRYSGEGAESLLAFFWQLLQDTTENKMKQIVVAMPHRGRTALQTALLGMRPAKVFRKLSGKSEFPDDVDAMSDVISHFHISDDLTVNGQKIRFSMVRNPSHLEAANPVAMGKARSKQQTYGEGAFGGDQSVPFGSQVLSVIVHGDAAFAGQGINQECLNMAYVPHFEVGGSLHLIVNNQVGFTTPGERGRGTDYSSDLAKTIQAPVFHVNGDDPEAVALVTALAFAYQQRFRKDVFVDMNCFRRWGHNELDDPMFTNPSVYRIVNERKSVPDLYVEQLVGQGVLKAPEAEAIRKKYFDYLSQEQALAANFQPEPTYFGGQWQGLQSASNEITYWDTGLDYSLLHYIGQKSVEIPMDFNIHPHLLKTHVQARLKRLAEGERIDWATAEALAVGSLMYQGHNVRLSGEDVGRGTFSHRHAMLVDQQTNEMYVPLNEMAGGKGGKLEVAHSILSEEAVLAFEYGMAIDNPNNLIIWEAQFGDFANGAQIIIDNFIITGETKWMDSNGLVLLLPHGFDGAASEHSSCRLERFLQLCSSSETACDTDNVNVNIVNPTTAAQYYHVLRRQLLRNFRKPLIVVAPKTLLRLSDAASPYTDFTAGSQFRNVIGDERVADAAAVRRVIFCSGKHYYNLQDQRVKMGGAQDTAIVRVESLCPFPMIELQRELAKYKGAKTFVWSQEEHRNMGAWSFVRPRFENLLGKKLVYSGRAEAPTTATGIGNVHKREAAAVVEEPFAL